MNKRQTESMITRAESYFNMTAGRKEKAIDDDDCNSNFAVSDAKLADTCTMIANCIKNNSVYSFGVILTIHGDDSGLLQRCCHCPGKNNTFSDRNKLRNTNRLQLEKWLKSAKQWVVTGDEPNQSEKITDTRTKGAKRQIRYRGIKQ